MSARLLKIQTCTFTYKKVIGVENGLICLEQKNGTAIPFLFAFLTWRGHYRACPQIRSCLNK